MVDSAVEAVEAVEKGFGLLGIPYVTLVLSEPTTNADSDPVTDF